MWARTRHLWLPALAVLGIALARLFGGDYQVDTGLYAGVAWHMVNEGTWWTPMQGDVPYFNKPPLCLWLHAAVFALAKPLLHAGPPLWLIRLPVVLQAAACAACAAGAARTLAGPKVGLLTGLILALSLEFFIHLDRSIMDYAVAAGMMAAVWIIAAAERRGAPARLVWAGVPIGLALLAKPFFALLLLPLMAAWLVGRGRWRWLGWLAAAGGVAVALAGPWHVSMALLHGEVFTGQYIGRESIDRVTGDLATRDKPWWFYAEVIALRWLPWSLLLPPTLWAIARHRKAAGARHARLLLWALLWAGGWLVLASVVNDRRPRYILHVWPALAGVVALWVARWAPPGVRGPGTRRLGRLVGGVVLLGGAIAGLRLAGVRLIPADDPGPEWPRIAETLRHAQNEGVSVFNASLPPFRAGQVYLDSGVWPRAVADPGLPGGRRTPETGDLVIAHTAVLGDALRRAGLAAEAVAEPVLEAGDYTIVRWP